MDVYIALPELTAYAGSTARTLPVTGTVSARRVRVSLRWSLAALRRREGRILKKQEELTEAERWLRDNFYLAEREAQEASRSLRSAGALRCCQDGALIVALCRVLLSVGGGEADTERLAAFLEGFQSFTVLQGEELRLLPAALRCAAVERLSALYAQSEPEAAEAGALFTTLRELSSLDLGPVLEGADRAMALLRKDPAGIFEQMDEESRAACRRQVERLAKRFNIPEHRVARRALELSQKSDSDRCRHVGYYLFRDPLGLGKPRSGAGLYIALNAVLPVLLSLACGLWTKSVWAALLLFLPVTELVKEALDRLLLRLTPPRHVLRLALKQGVPPEGKTICVVSALLTGEDTARRAARHLEEYRMAARDCGENLLFGLLCDLPEASEAYTKADRKRLSAAVGAVEELNRRYGGGFFLFSRERTWSRDIAAFAPWERKRGAMLELCRMLNGKPSRLELGAGERSALRGIRYVLTLDEDTRLEPGTALGLIGAALHPLNVPVVDPLRRVVREGYGLLQPRIGVRLADTGKNAFTRLFAPQGGTDPYGADTGEVYMDAFSSGGFAGKGLVDVRAYLDCMEQRVPERLMLSHDAVEGAFLRGGFVGDLELTDAFPASVLSFFSRQDRWIRGDWQNLRWLFRSGRALPPIERWRLYDSLRRSLVPVGVMAAFGGALCLGEKALLLPAAASLCAVFMPLFREIFARLFRPVGEAAARITAGVLHGPGETFLRPVCRLILLPYESYVNLSAALTALWRLFVSGRRRLVWRTAEEGERLSGSGVTTYFRSMAPACGFGLLLLAFAGTVTGRAAGCVWLLSPVFAAALSREKKGKPPLTEEDSAWLRKRAEEIWGYFRTECVAETHFLPPDNVQAEPPAPKAERLSPTNLGLSLLSAVAALELGAAGEGEFLTFCTRLLTAAERMERWEGHFYNWYDTRSLAPLSPRYVSTVDSGNLWACLLTAAAALRRHGAPELADRADALRLPMDFTPLYDSHRHLFRIGVDPEGGVPEKSWYDLMESEERLTGFIAVASGQVPLKHWRRLSRAQVGFHGFRGMVSWSGTMFEYLMPELMLPFFPNSALGESARFAVYVQRCRTLGREKLWGMSESAFASLDTSLHYRYKAHGAPELSLSRDQTGERVIAPYASFLALLVSPRPAMKNLRALERAGLLGPRGFWEAADFTPGRDRDGEGSPVRSLMVHHLGMSICAIADVLCGGVLRSLFLSDPAMAAYTGLLQERVPLGGVLLHRREDPRPRHTHTLEGQEIRTGEGFDPFCPEAAALSNGLYHLLFTDSGISRAHYGELIPYRSPAVPWEGTHGLELCLITGEEHIDLLPQPGDGTVWHTLFRDEEAVLTGERGTLRWSIAAAVARQGAGELRRVAIHRGENAPAAVLELSFEPVLLPERDYLAEPSFGRLGLFTQAQDGLLTVLRLPRGRQGERYLCAGADRAAAFSSDLRRYPGRGGVGTFTANTGWQSEPRVTLRVELPAGEGESSVCFALCAARTDLDAAAGVRTILKDPSGFSMARVAASLWGMELREVGEAWAHLRALFWPTLSREAAALPGVRREELWKLGLSGDDPIVGMPCTGAGAVNAAVQEVRLHALLTMCGVRYDLVLLPADRGDYRQTLRARLERELTAMELPGTVGVRGGVHFVSPAEEGIIRACASVWIGNEGLTLPERDLSLPMYTPKRKRVPTVIPDVEYNEENAVSFSTADGLPPRAWTHLLTDGALSWLCAESGTLGLWYKNARECPLLVRRGDPLSPLSGELLTMETPQETVSFFADDGAPCRVTYSFGAAVWEKQTQGGTLRLTGCVVPETGVRILLLESGVPGLVRWCAPVQLAPEREDAPAADLGRDADALTARSVRCPLPGVTLTARCSLPWETTASDAQSLLTGEAKPVSRSALPALGGTFRMEAEAVLLLGTGDAPELLRPAAAREAIERTKGFWRSRVCIRHAQGGERTLLPLLNGWAAWQTMTFRLWGRSSVYQSGGAVGFRDQLQDYVNLMPLDPAACRAHILTCCAHQFIEGDVQHWWHPGPNATDKGVRTRCSDDLLWLPWALCAYVRATGDESLLSAEAPYLTSEPLGEGEESRYETPELAQERGTVWDHCLRSAQLVTRRGVGAHRLLRMGSGDWNDGFDRLGEGGESVWLTFFASAVFEQMAKIMSTNTEMGQKLLRLSQALGSAGEAAWETDHYLRGYYADGTPLGSREGDACCLDSVAQSAAAFCPWTDRKRVNTALDTALRELRDAEHHLIRLYTPPVAPGQRSPGYVGTYGPGFRENGGQYTHAAVWLARALFRVGRRREGAELLRELTLSPRSGEYGGEPWLLPADVYTAPGETGRAGWTGYTGAAGWWWRTAWENMLSLKMDRGELIQGPVEEGWHISGVKKSDSPVQAEKSVLE